MASSLSPETMQSKSDEIIRPGLGILRNPCQWPPERLDDVDHSSADSKLPNRRHLRVYSRDPSYSRFEGAEAVIDIPYENLTCENEATVKKGNGKGKRKSKNHENEDIPNPRATLLFDFQHRPFSDTDLQQANSDRTVDDENSSFSLDYLDSRRALSEHGVGLSQTTEEFRVQMIYALCTATYERFTRALGRLPDFSTQPATAEMPKQKKVDDICACMINPPRLRIWTSTSESMKNAFYDAKGGLVFGQYTNDEEVFGRTPTGARVHTALTHDIVVHEMVHALLDGLRPNFMIPTNPDVLGFHEGFADLVAVFLHFTHDDAVRLAIQQSPNSLDHGLLIDIARQFGQTTGKGRGPTRSAICDRATDPQSDVPAEYCYVENLPPHKLGSILVSAVFEAFRVVYMRRTQSVRSAVQGDAIPAGLTSHLAREAKRLADQFLNIVIRAIDYTPPVDIRFGDYLRAMITADRDLIANDRYGYREALINAFTRYKIPVELGDDAVSEETLMWPGIAKLTDEIVGELAKINNKDTDKNKNKPDITEDTAREHIRSVMKTTRKIIDVETDSWTESAFAVGRLQRYQEVKDWLLEMNAKEDLSTLTHIIREKLCLPAPKTDQRRHSRSREVIVESVRRLTRVSPEGGVSYGAVVEIVQRDFRNDLTIGGSTFILDQHGSVRYVIGKSIDCPKRQATQQAYLKQPQSRDIASALHFLKQSYLRLNETAGRGQSDENIIEFASNWRSAFNNLKTKISLRLHAD